MKEAFLHYLWQTRQLDFSNLATTSGVPLEILDFGQFNHHSGPDFLNGKVRIGQTIWVGQIEMHLKASDWKRHQHSEDPAYDNVILHVVLEEDVPIFHKDGSRIPCIQIKGRIPEGVKSRYERLLQSPGWIPCQRQWPDLLPPVWKEFLDDLLQTRLDRKARAIEQMKAFQQRDWDNLAYQLIARYLGAWVNMQPMSALASQTPWNLLQRHVGEGVQVESLLFGQAGMLHSGFEDTYPKTLYREYNHLSQKYGLTPIAQVQWKFARMRPAGFPTLRIAQLGGLVRKYRRIFSQLLIPRSLAEWKEFLQSEPHSYWNAHYRFEEPSESKLKTLGDAAKNTILINGILPLLYAYGKCMNKEDFQRKAIDVLHQLPAENNAIIRGWKKLGVEPKSAADSQALLELKKSFCEQYRCLSCKVGRQLLREPICWYKPHSIAQQ